MTSFGLSCPGRSRRLYGHYNNVNCTAYHSPGQQMLSGGNDHKILVWSVRGSADYGEVLREQRALAVERKARQDAELFGQGVTEEEGGAQARLVSQEVLPHTQDTWSDEDDDDDDENDDDNKKGVDR